MREAVTLIESESPLCPVQALAEKTENAVYFYLFYPLRKNGHNLKACWVCNCREAPERLDAGDKLSMMPQGGFRHAPGGMTVSPEGLHITWLPDGDSAVLLQNGEVLAVIPPKAGLYDFPGFSRYAAGQNCYAWELPPEHAAYWKEQAHAAEALWRESHTSAFWQGMQNKHLTVLNEFFGKNTGYYAIDDGKYPLRAVIEGNRDGVTYGFTAFLSIFPQPEIEAFIRGAEEHRRIEFGFAAEDAVSGVKMQAYNCFMAMAKAICRDTVFFAHGHTNTWEGIPGFCAFLFVNARAVRGLPAPEYGSFAGDPINLLWAVPVTREEYDFVVKNGVSDLLHRAKDISRIHIFDGRPKFNL